MSTSQKFHLLAVSLFVTGLLFFAASWMLNTFNALWMLSILCVGGFAFIEAWVETRDEP